MDDERSIPLISLRGNLIVSVQFELSDQIMERLISDVTRRIEETTVTGLILDFSGADLLDSHVTRRLRDLAVTARVMGVHTVVCGLRRAVVITLVEMGLSLSGVTTALNLERALEVLDRMNEQSRFSPSGPGSCAAEQGLPERERGAADVSDR
ncbi:MAG TPA: STAS domain-containing protein [Polyangiaceae bacterium]|nr:STAS domain-containing protein [Polyangiaceae bacterium]